MRALADGMMAWSNAKQTALRAAFQNSGVDEQPQTANKFKHYGGSYDSYVNDFMSQEANMTGFSQFMQHAVTGYGAPLGEIAPGELSDLHITSGYGWTQHEDESFTGSFPGSNNYQDFDNYVEVQVYGSMMYPLEALTFADYFGDGVVNTLTAMVGVGSYLKYIGCMGTEGDNTVNELKEVYGLGYLLAALYCVITAAAFRGMVEYLPCGFTFTDRDIAAYTTNNPIAVEVKRHKKNTDMGMWNFQYGNVIAKSAAHAFQESSDVTIEPVLLESMKDLGSFLGSVGGSISPENWASPNMIITIVQGALCLGAVGTMGGLIAMAAGDIISNIWDEAPSCDWDDWDCVVEWLAYAGAAAFAESMFAGGPGMVSMTILQYIIYMALCTGSSSYQPQSGDATMNAGALGSGMDWFRTDLHLFETELYSGYIQ
jgi:hypothetical protein